MQFFKFTHCILHTSLDKVLMVTVQYRLILLLYSMWSKSFFTKMVYNELYPTNKFFHWTITVKKLSVLTTALFFIIVPLNSDCQCATGVSTIPLLTQYSSNLLQKTAIISSLENSFLNSIFKEVAILFKSSGKHSSFTLNPIPISKYFIFSPHSCYLS